MLRSLRFYSLCLLFCVTIMSLGCGPSALRTRSWMTPCDTCIKPQCDKKKCIEGVKNFARVTDTLWRGEQPTQEGFCNLEAQGVKAVINLRYDHDDIPLLPACTKLRYFRIKTHAWHPEEEDLIKFLRILKDKKNLPAFVHCAAGKDRTGYFVATYRIIEQNWTANDAIHEMFDFGYHPWWFGNPSFLRKIEKKKDYIRKKVNEKGSPILPDYAKEGTCKCKK